MLAALQLHVVGHRLAAMFPGGYGDSPTTGVHAPAVAVRIMFACRAPTTVLTVLNKLCLPACRAATSTMQYAPPVAAAGFNDLFGLFIWPISASGVAGAWRNVAIIPGTNLPVSIANINPRDNSASYISNPW